MTNHTYNKLRTNFISSLHDRATTLDNLGRCGTSKWMPDQEYNKFDPQLRFHDSHTREIRWIFQWGTLLVILLLYVEKVN